MSWAETIVKSFATEYYERSYRGAGFAEIVGRNSSNPGALNGLRPPTVKPVPGVAAQTNLPEVYERDHVKNYFAFNGSLTTPPCSEGVKWHMMQETVQASKAQMDKFMSIFGGNARPVQPLNGRPVGEF